jgi:hypothetical protein
MEAGRAYGMTAARLGPNAQEDLFEVEATRSLLDTLIADSRLYHSGADYKALLDFVVRLRNFAPFNAMLLQVQKPGLTYAASAPDWWERFKRKPKEGARPLLILWPFGPVSLVYDVMDTEGKELPQDVASFVARGPIGETEIEIFRHRTNRRKIFWDDLDAGDGRAGSIRRTRKATNEKERNEYRLLVNKNHAPAVRFATLAHELAHLFLGHLGLDQVLDVPDRHNLSYQQVELEAESVAFIVCKVTLGFVFLAVTGGEALYADLGHQPIRAAWFALVLPALLLNDFAQGALVLRDASAIENPFYRLFPPVMLVPVVVLATIATIIASQAVITGAYSVTRQAIQLGLIPRLTIRHTSEMHEGQIYIPRANTALLIGVLLLVAIFRTSDPLMAWP